MGVNIKFLILVLILLVSACSINESVIHYEKSGTAIAVRDGISLDEARRVIDFIYENFKDIPVAAVGEGFGSLKSLSHWSAYPKCDYVVAHFEYDSADKSFIAGDDVFINKVSNRFNFEPEITAKMAKKRARIYEVPISYSGRTYEEGKKIGMKDGIEALWTIFKYRFID